MLASNVCCFARALLISIVRHLSLADKIIVLGLDGRVSEQGTFSNLKSQNGFVSQLLDRPELLHTTANIDMIEQNISGPIKSTAASKVLRGPSTHDVQDLTRQIGDMSVYKYYLKSIGWKLAIVNMTACFVWALSVSFPCKCCLTSHHNMLT